jgi:hypothetical protein
LVIAAVYRCDNRLLAEWALAAEAYLALLYLNHLVIVAVWTNLRIEACQQFPSIARHKAYACNLAFLQRFLWKERVVQCIRMPRDDLISQRFCP